MSKVTELTARLAAPLAAERGCTLWDVEYVREAGTWYLRVLLDKEGGVDILDCEAISRRLSDRLDEIDPIEESYDLEVSSPGIERDLRTDAHIDASVGERVQVRFFAPVEGRKTVEGVLLGRDERGAVLVECEGAPRAFARESIAKIRTVFDF